MAGLANLGDPYERRARLYPVILVVLPLALAVASWIPTDASFPTLAGITLFGLALAAFLTQLGRDEGERKEPELFRGWGGKPSERALSYRGHVFGEMTLSRYHLKLTAIAPELRFPENAVEEEADPDAAARVYRAANELLLSRTRDHGKFPLVFAENINYGYRRNLWGMKLVGVGTAVLGLGAGVIRLLTTSATDSDLPVAPLVAALVGAILLVLWLLRVTPSWVRIAAEAYARQLISAIELLERA